jgi:hypothetical protein
MRAMPAGFDQGDSIAEGKPMQRPVNKEATFREVFAEVDVVDVGSVLKGALGSAIGWLIFLFISATASMGWSLFGPEFHVPDIVWITLVIFFAVMSLTSSTSHHEWTVEFFFPKMGPAGWLLVTGYITALLEAFRITYHMHEAVERFLATAMVYMIMMMPAVLFIGLLELGYHRLIQRREQSHGVTAASEAFAGAPLRAGAGMSK